VEGKHLKKTMCFVFFVLFFISCNKAHALEAAENFDVRTTLIGFTPKQEKKIHSASKLIRKIVRSTEFKEKVLNHTWKGKKQFADNKGLTNEEIYKKILDGSERQLRLGSNNTMDLEIELYTDYDSITIGYTYPNIVRIYMNRKYFNKFRPYQVADNMMHEWLHKIGFGHAVKNTPERPYSVPYAIGYIVKGIAREMRKQKLAEKMNLLAEQSTPEE
jgi:hypothetical protein